MGFTMHFYIIFGTNLLTGDQVQIVVFAYFSLSQKRNIKRNETFGSVIFGKNVIQRTWSGRQATNKEATRQGGAPAPWARPHPRGPLVAPLTSFFLLYIHTYPENIQGHHEKLFPPPKPSVSARSNLGAFVGAPPEGESTMEGLYIISQASPMSCE